MRKIRLVIYANQVLRAGVQAQEALLQKIRRDGGIQGVEEMMSPLSHIFDLQGVPQMKDHEETYLAKEPR